MNEQLQLNHPWLVAVWPGMGHVALNAGLYLLSKLGMNSVAELNPSEIFDVETVEVSEGIIQPARRPQTRVFVWTDPKKKHDIVLVVGEAQPPIGRLAFCRQLIAFAKSMKVERVFTFAAMATQARPSAECRVFGAATDKVNLEELKRLELKILENGTIGGLNGVLLAVAAEAGLHGVCLLGEMPHIFAQIPFPKASHAILEVFTTLADIELDFSELDEQVRAIEQQLGDIISRAEQQFNAETAEEENDEPTASDEPEVVEEVNQLPTNEPLPAVPPRPSSTRRAIEELFDAASTDRAKAFELKGELDRFGLFKEYEDRFLDLFRTAG
ncbi:MAG: PAC2 family protein [Planctomycetes bacterium]|nr:PAC2 family protein [Planctomycetota bacterium]